MILQSNAMKKNGILIVSSLILGITAFFVRDLLLGFAMTYILGEKISFEKSWELPYQTFPFLLFVISFSIIPFLYLIVKRIGELNSTFKKVFSISLITGSGLILLISRIVYIKFKASQINEMLRRAEFSEGAEIPRIKFEEIYLEMFFGIGLVIGMLIAILIFRKKRLATR